MALAPNFGTILVGRALGGLSTAGGSVTLGMTADLWEPDTQQYAVAAVVFSSVAGSGIGPIVGGICRGISTLALEHLDPVNFRWFCSGYAFASCARNKNHGYDGFNRKRDA